MFVLSNICSVKNWKLELVRNKWINMHFILFIYFLRVWKKNERIKKGRKKEHFFCTHYFARLTATQINKWINKKKRCVICEFLWVWKKNESAKERNNIFLHFVWTFLNRFRISKLSLFWDVFTKCASHTWWTIHNLLWFKISQTNQFTQISITTVSASLIHLQYMKPTWQN